MAEVTLAGLAGRRVILNVFHIDTGICATSTRKFNELAAGLDNTTVVCVSADLPFALKRFCGAEGHRERHHRQHLPQLVRRGLRREDGRWSPGPR